MHVVLLLEVLVLDVILQVIGPEESNTSWQEVGTIVSPNGFRNGIRNTSPFGESKEHDEDEEDDSVSVLKVFLTKFMEITLEYQRGCESSHKHAQLCAILVAPP